MSSSIPWSEREAWYEKLLCDIDTVKTLAVKIAPDFKRPVEDSFLGVQRFVAMARDNAKHSEENLKTAKFWLDNATRLLQTYKNLPGRILGNGDIEAYDREFESLKKYMEQVNMQAPSKSMVKIRLGKILDSANALLSLHLKVGTIRPNFAQNVQKFLFNFVEKMTQDGVNIKESKIKVSEALQKIALKVKAEWIFVTNGTEEQYENELRIIETMIKMIGTVDAASPEPKPLINMP